MTAYSFFTVFVIVMALLNGILAFVAMGVNKKAKHKVKIIIKVAEIVSVSLTELGVFYLIMGDKVFAPSWILVFILWLIFFILVIQDLKKIKSQIPKT